MKYGIGNPRPLAEGMGEAVAKRTVLRKFDKETNQYQTERDIKDNKPWRWENWGEVAKRVAAGNLGMVKDESSKSQRILKEEECQRLEEHIANASILMSGRHLQHGDETMKKRPLEVYSNCSTANSSFMLYYLLLNGSGVGRCYDDDLMIVDWSRQPNIRVALDETHPDFDETCMESLQTIKHCYGKQNVIIYTVQDSREGWAKALEYLEVKTWEGCDGIIVFDFSKVRARNELIGGMQLRPSSGPAPTMKMFEKIKSLKGCNLPKWWQTMYVDHYAAESVLVGGARRSARIAIKYWRDPDIMDFIAIKRSWIIPDSCDKNGKVIKKGRKTVPLWSANNSVGVDEEFWNEAGISGTWAGQVFERVCSAAYHHGTGEPGLINLHKLQTVREEGAFNSKSISSKRYEMAHASELCAKLDQIASAKRWMMIVNPCLDREKSLFKTQTGPKGMYALSIGEEVWTGKNWAKITKLFAKGYKTIFKYFINYQPIECTKDHMICTDGGKVPINNLYQIGYFTYQGKLFNINNRTEIGTKEVWDFAIDHEDHSAEVNGVVVSNCGEICLNINGGYCVIADCALYHCDSIEECVEAVKLAARALIRTNMLDCVFSHETKRTNRIGVGLTGIHEWMWKFFNVTFKDVVTHVNNLKDKVPTFGQVDNFKNTDYDCQKFIDTLKLLSDVVHDESVCYSEELGVVTPHTCLTIKPSGSVSKLFGLTEGAHLPSIRELIRWVQFRYDDPLVQKYKSLGYRTKQLRTYEGTTVVGFPMRPLICSLGIPNLMIAPEASMQDQFTWLKILEKYWLNGGDDAATYGNQVSYTLKYDRNEIDYSSYKLAILENMPEVRCCSVMPGNIEAEHEYLPEEPVSGEEYLRYLEELDNIKVEEDVDEKSLQCASGACPL